MIKTKSNAGIISHRNPNYVPTHGASLFKRNKVLRKVVDYFYLFVKYNEGCSSNRSRLIICRRSVMLLAPFESCRPSIHIAKSLPYTTRLTCRVKSANITSLKMGQWLPRRSVSATRPGKCPRQLKRSFGICSTI